jgi:hypothetical protein
MPSSPAPADAIRALNTWPSVQKHNAATDSGPDAAPISHQGNKRRSNTPSSSSPLSSHLLRTTEFYSKSAPSDPFADRHDIYVYMFVHIYKCDLLLFSFVVSLLPLHPTSLSLSFPLLASALTLRGASAPSASWSSRSADHLRLARTTLTLSDIYNWSRDPALARVAFYGSTSYVQQTKRN